MSRSIGSVRIYLLCTKARAPALWLGEPILSPGASPGNMHIVTMCIKIMHIVTMCINSAQRTNQFCTIPVILPLLIVIPLLDLFALRQHRPQHIWLQLHRVHNHPRLLHQLRHQRSVLAAHPLQVKALFRVLRRGSDRVQIRSSAGNSC